LGLTYGALFGFIVSWHGTVGEQTYDFTEGFFFGWGTRRFMAFKMPERSVLFLIQAYPATILARWPPIAMELKYTSVVWEVSHKIQHSRNLA
jgi:hypothetical protein